MRWVVALIGVPVVLGLIAISVTMNFRFGLMLGRSDNDGLVYASASACADILKCLLPVILAWSWDQRRYLVTVIGGLLFLIFTAYSVASSLGYAAINRSERTGQRAADISRYKDLRAELDQKLAERGRLPAFRPAATIEADMLAARQHARWMATHECASATLTESRSFCDGYFRLKAEQGTAEAASRLDSDIRALREKLAALGQSAHHTGADPQIEVIASILSLGQDTAKLMLIILLSALVECGSGFGFMVVLAMWSDPEAAKQDEKGRETFSPATPLIPAAIIPEPQALPRPPLALQGPDTSSMSAWADLRLVKSARLKVFAATLYADYIQWARDNGQASPVNWALFAQWLNESGYSERVTPSGRVLYLGIGLKQAARSA